MELILEPNVLMVCFSVSADVLNPTMFSILEFMHQLLLVEISNSDTTIFQLLVLLFKISSSDFTLSQRLVVELNKSEKTLTHS